MVDCCIIAIQSELRLARCLLRVDVVAKGSPLQQVAQNFVNVSSAHYYYAARMGKMATRMGQQHRHLEEAAAAQTAARR